MQEGRFQVARDDVSTCNMSVLCVYHLEVSAVEFAICGVEVAKHMSTW